MMMMMINRARKLRTYKMPKKRPLERPKDILKRPLERPKDILRIQYILLRIDYVRPRSFHFGSAVLSTQHFFFINQP